MARESPDIPHSIRKVYRHFERWRSRTRPACRFRSACGRQRCSWPGRHGVSPAAQALRLEYGKLRRLMESGSPVVKSRMVKCVWWPKEFSIL
jgi:hypothetical protein